MSEKQTKNLSQVLNFIKGLIDSNLAKKKFWLKAEVSSINFHRNSGHCYLELVENVNNQTVAQCRATIWSSNVQAIKVDLGDDFLNILKKGTEILCMVEVIFAPAYGLFINIHQVDRYFALGALEQRKIETLDRLEREQLLGGNKIHKLPLVIQSIAVIGSPGTSGHTDFMKHLSQNEYRYQFRITVLRCQVQGDSAEQEILARLKEAQVLKYDVVVLIRGGGSKLDLEVFNSYEIAKAIAKHNRPIFSGIGHETDISVADLVANEQFKTPSAVAAFIIERNRSFDIQVTKLYNDVFARYQLYLQKQSHRIKQASLVFKSTSVSYTQLRRGNLHSSGNRIAREARRIVAEKRQTLASAVVTIKNVNRICIQPKITRKIEALEVLQITTMQAIDLEQKHLKHVADLLALQSQKKLRVERDLINNSISLVELYHPDKTLKRGYSIARINGQQIRDAEQVTPGDTIDIELVSAHLRATVTSKSLKNSKWKTLLMKVLQKS